MGGRQTAAVEQRRQQVAELWLRGVNTATIAKQLHTPCRTIRNDLQKIRQQIQQENQEELIEQWHRSLAVLRMLQLEAWKLFHKVDDRSVNKASALNAILSAEDRIMKLQGTMTADLKIDAAVTATTTVSQDVQTAIIHALAEHPEAKAAVAEALLRLSEAGKNAKLS